MKTLNQRSIVVMLAIAGFFFAVSLGVFLLNIIHIPEPLIIHFDAFHGVDVFGSVGDVAGIWIMGFLMAIINVVVADVFYLRERVLSYAFIGANILISIFLLILMAVIASVN